MQKNSRNTSLLRVSQVLERFTASESKWWAGVKEGMYSQPTRLGSRYTMWRSDEIDQLIDRISRDSKWVFLDLQCGNSLTHQRGVFELRGIKNAHWLADGCPSGDGWVSSEYHAKIILTGT